MNIIYHLTLSLTLLVSLSTLSNSITVRRYDSPESVLIEADGGRYGLFGPILSQENILSISKSSSNKYVIYDLNCNKIEKTSNLVSENELKLIEEAKAKAKANSPGIVLYQDNEYHNSGSGTSSFSHHQSSHESSSQIINGVPVSSHNSNQFNYSGSDLQRNLVSVSGDDKAFNYVSTSGTVLTIPSQCASEEQKDLIDLLKTKRSQSDHVMTKQFEDMTKRFEQTMEDLDERMRSLDEQIASM